MSITALIDTLSSSANRRLLCQDEQAWTGRQLLDAADEFGQQLGPGRVLGMLADNGPAWAIADLATLRRGAIHLPLPGFFSAAQLTHALTESACDTLLTDQPQRIASLGLGFSHEGDWLGLAMLKRRCAAVRLPAGTAKISFTSGSTGHPKGVCLSAAGLLDTAIAVAKRLGDLPLHRHLAVLPLALLLENVAGLYAPWLLGSEVRLPRLAALGWRGMAGFDPAALQAVLAQTEANSIILVPELLKAWTLYLQASGQPAPARLLVAAVGGAQVSPVLLAAARSAGIPAYQGYGLTECGSVVSLNRSGDDGCGVGRPLEHVRVTLVDGEVRVATRAFLGYLHDANATDNLLFRTGDLGHLDDAGHLHLSGRRKHLLITSFGRNIAPEWVEAALLAQPAIAQALVVGDAKPWLSALVVPTANHDAAAVEVAIAAVNATLPDYARIGGWVMAEPFTPLNGLSTGNGRPVRQAILNQYAAPLAALYAREEMHDEVL
ncbi:AMP-dependent synthetase/ligase [Rhodocyclaceae bacterium]